MSVLNSLCPLLSARYPLLSCPAAFSIRLALLAKFIGNMKCWFHSCPLLKYKIWFQRCFQTKRGELKVMLTHDYWHDFTVSIKMQGSIENIYRNHPHCLKANALSYHSTISFHITQHSYSLKIFSITDLYLCFIWYKKNFKFKFIW